MQNPSIAYQLNDTRSPSQRYAGIAFVGALHIALIYALINGLAATIVTRIPNVLHAVVIDTQPQKQPDKVPVPKPNVEIPKMDTVPEPKIVIATQQPTMNVAPAAEAPADIDASALGSTHTIPPYPPSARRLGHQGRVELRLTISPDGHVLKADVVTSSGWPELDQEAASWIVAHWRYSPAIRGGVPVASTAMAAVKFDLKNAR